MNFIATSDVHGNLKNLVPFRQVLELALQQAMDKGCPLYIGGDLNDTKASLRSEFVAIIVDLFTRYSSVNKYILIGNHDLNNHHNHLDHSLEFMKSLSNTEVIDSPRLIMEDWYAIPYRHTNKEILAELDIAKKEGHKKLLIHQGIMGAKQSDYVVDESSITPEDLIDFDLVLTGHYHTHQTVGNATYFGSPFTVSFAEANQDKFIWSVEEGGAKLIPIETKCRKHIQLVFENKLPKKVEGLEENSIIKVVLKGDRNFCLKTKKEKIQKLLGVESFSLTTDILSETKRRIESHQIHKPMEVVNQYLENVDTHLNKEELAKYLQRVRNENN